MRYTISLLTLLMFSCGRLPIDISSHSTKPVIHKTDEKFRSYINKFESYKGIRVNVPIVFKSNMPTTEAGVCTKWSSGYREITINPKIWYNLGYMKNLEEVARQQLIDHELGHCVLNLKHNDKMLANGHKASIMHESLFSKYDLNYLHDNGDYYINELFSKL